MKKALIVIDAQKEYYAGGGYPLWNMDNTIANIKKAMTAAKEKNVPLYRSLEDFYAADSADLAILSCPIQFHKEQALLAMKNGSHVLCEKPLTVEIADALEMQAAAEADRAEAQRLREEMEKLKAQLAARQSAAEPQSAPDQDGPADKEEKG